jgi:hypothetical protein
MMKVCKMNINNFSFEELTVDQSVKKVSSLYGISIFIIFFVTVRYGYLTLARRIQRIPTTPSSLKLISIFPSQLRL